MICDKSSDNPHGTSIRHHRDSWPWTVMAITAIMAWVKQERVSYLLLSSCLTHAMMAAMAMTVHGHESR